MTLSIVFVILFKIWTFFNKQKGPDGSCSRSHFFRKFQTSNFNMRLKAVRVPCFDVHIPFSFFRCGVWMKKFCRLKSCLFSKKMVKCRPFLFQLTHQHFSKSLAKRSTSTDPEDIRMHPTHTRVNLRFAAASHPNPSRLPGLPAEAHFAPWTRAPTRQFQISKISKDVPSANLKARNPSNGANGPAAASARPLHPCPPL